MQINPFNIFRQKTINPNNISKINPDDYVTISSEFNKPFSKGMFDYLTGLKYDIATFAKDNKVKIQIEPQGNYKVFSKKYYMNILAINISNNKKNAFSIFLISPPFEKSKNSFDCKLFECFREILQKKSMNKGLFKFKKDL